jgi:aspartate racemase
MKTIGMLGGMSWESSIEYYRIVNQLTSEKLGRHHSAPIVLYSVDFDEIERLQHQGKWDRLTQILIATAQRVEAAGADFLVICTNTMHKMADQVQEHLSIPLLHIADATAAQINTLGVHTVGLLGTKFTMEEDFYRERLVLQHNVEVLIPDTGDREVIHRIIYDELCVGTIREESRERCMRILSGMRTRGAEAIVLGCTELPLLLRQEDSEVPLMDTTAIHARAAVEFALA